MSVTLFVQNRSGDYNLELEVDDKNTALRAIELIRETGGYWYDSKISKELTLGLEGFSMTSYTWKGGTIFIPLHRIDYMEIK